MARESVRGAEPLCMANCQPGSVELVSGGPGHGGLKVEELCTFLLVVSHGAGLCASGQVLHEASW